MRCAHSHCIIALWLLALSGCGGPRRSSPKPPPLPTGEAVYRVRHNPARCLHNMPELQVEIQVGEGWERVALQRGEEADDTGGALLARFEDSPQGVVRVLGTVSESAEPFGVGHYARQFSVDIIDPPPETDD